jgi:hypothetical protein
MGGEFCHGRGMISPWHIRLHYRLHCTKCLPRSVFWSAGKCNRNLWSAPEDLHKSTKVKQILQRTMTVVLSVPFTCTSEIRLTPSDVPRMACLRFSLIKAGYISSRGKYDVATLHIQVQKQIDSSPGVNPLVQARAIGKRGNLRERQTISCVYERRKSCVSTIRNVAQSVL